MNNPEYYPENPGALYAPQSGTALSAVPAPQPLAIAPPDSRFYRRMDRRTSVIATQEHFKARLAGEIIVNTTALSALGDQAISAVPSAEQPVRGIINAYAVHAITRINERRL